MERQKALEKEREREEKKKEEGKRVGEHLQVQMKEIKQREAEVQINRGRKICNNDMCIIGQIAERRARRRYETAMGSPKSGEKD